MTKTAEALTAKARAARMEITKGVRPLISETFRVLNNHGVVAIDFDGFAAKFLEQNPGVDTQTVVGKGILMMGLDVLHEQGTIVISTTKTGVTLYQVVEKTF